MAGENIHRRDNRKRVNLSEPDIIPDELRIPGFGDWTAGVNGHSRFIESAIRHFKDAASRCADAGLDEEYKIFSKRVMELQQLLDDHQSSHEYK